jgi:hypothetical protein
MRNLLLTIFLIVLTLPSVNAQCVFGELFNGNFEFDDDEKYWSREEGGHIQGDVYYEGNYAIACGNGGISQSVKVSENTNYSLSYWLKTDDSNDYFDIYANNQSISHIIQNTEDWKKFTFNFTTEPNENSIRLIFLGGVSYIDNIQLSADFSFHTSGHIEKILCESESYVSPSGNYTYTAPGVYKDTLSNSHGCDSIITITISQNPIATNLSKDGKTMNAITDGEQYQWVNGNNIPIIDETTKSYKAPQNGTYRVKVTTDGCTSVSKEIMIETPFIYPNINDVEDIAFYGKDLYVLYENDDVSSFAGNQIGILEDITYGSPTIVNVKPTSFGREASGLCIVEDSLYYVMPRSRAFVRLDLTADSLVNKVINQNNGSPLKTPVISGNYLYYYDFISDEIYRFNYKLPNQTPEVVTPSIYDFRDMVIKDNIMYMAADGTISTLDLNQSNPSFETLINHGTDISSMIFYNDVLLLSTYSYSPSKQFHILKVNPQDPSPQITPLINLTNLGRPISLAIYENILFVALKYRFEDAIVRYDLDVYTQINEPIVRQKISISPIPAKDIIYINNIETHGVAKILDISGKLVSTGKLSGNQLNISHLTSGIYFLQIQDNAQQYHVKFIKQ